MSDDYIEPSSDSFWEIGQYKRTVKRCEDGNKLCNDIVQMISDRADIEKTYAKNLKAWSKKWNDYLSKGSEYGTMKTTWTSALNEAEKMADIHLQTNNVLIDELNNEIKQWQKSNYPKSIVNQIKIAKEYEEEFKKAQKPWSKKYLVVEKTKKDYHSACKSLQSAKVQFANSQNDTAMSVDQKKKLEDKVEKYKKEVDSTKSKYKQALDELNSCNARYIEDMNTVYKRCDTFEKERLEFFIEKFIKFHNHLNIYERTNIEDIYTEFYKIIKQTNPEKDLISWSKENGAGMSMNWPVFEEYSEELKTIAKGRSKVAKDLNSDSNGVTMTSIKIKTDDVNENLETKSMSAPIESSNRDPWADSTASYSSQRSNEFATSFEDYNNNNNNQQNDPWKSPIYEYRSRSHQRNKSPFSRLINRHFSTLSLRITSRFNNVKSKSYVFNDYTTFRKQKIDNKQTQDNTDNLNTNNNNNNNPEILVTPDTPATDYINKTDNIDNIINPKPIRYFDTNGESTKTLTEDYIETRNPSEYADEDYRSKTPRSPTPEPITPTQHVQSKQHQPQQQKLSLTSQVLNMFNRYTSNQHMTDDDKSKSKFSFLTKSATTSSSSTINTVKTNKTCPPDMNNKRDNSYSRNKSQDMTDYEYESEVEVEPEYEPIRRAPLLINAQQQNKNNNFSTNTIVNPVQVSNTNLLNKINNKITNNNNYYKPIDYNLPLRVSADSRTIINAQTKIVSPVISVSPPEIVVTPQQQKQQEDDNISVHLVNINNLKLLHAQNNHKIQEIEKKKAESGFYYSKKLDDVYNDVPLDITELTKLNAEAEAAEALRLELEEKIRQEQLFEMQRQAAEAAKKRQDEWNVYKAITAARNQGQQRPTSPDEFYTREKLIDYYDNVPALNEDNISLGAISNISSASALQAAETIRKVVSPIVNEIKANNHLVSNNLKESMPNPFGDFDEEENQMNTTNMNTELSDDENNLGQNANYLNIKVRALYDYQSTEEDELSFKAGDEFIKLANEDDRGWCLGKIGTKIGLYPATYAINS